MRFYCRLWMFCGCALALSAAEEAGPPRIEAGLPEGAVARFGKGSLDSVRYVSGGLAVLGSAGVWTYDAETGALTGLSADLGYAYNYLYSPDGRWIAALPTEGNFTIRLWSAETGETFTLSDAAHSAAFSPDGREMALGGSRPQIWDVEKNELLRELEAEEEDHCSAMAYSADGTRLAGAGEAVYLWDAAGALLRTFPGGGRRARLRLSPDGKRLAVGKDGGAVQVWDAETGELAGTLKGGRGRLLSLLYSVDGSQLLTAYSEGPVQVWSAEAGSPLWTIHPSGRGFSAAEYSPDGSQLLVAWSNGSVWCWNVKTGELLRELEGAGFMSASYSPDGRRIVSASINGVVQVWDAATGSFLREIDRFHQNNSVFEGAISPDGRFAASTIGGGGIQVWSVESEAILRVLRGYDRDVYSLAFSPDGSSLVSGGWDGAVQVWDAETWELQRTLQEEGGSVHALSFSADGSRLAAGSRGAVQVWDMETGEQIQTLADTPWPNGLALSPDGLHLAVGGGAGSARVWSVETGDAVWTLREAQADESSIGDVAYSPDGKRLAAGLCGEYGSCAILVWDVESRERLPIFGKKHARENDYPGGELAFSPDGKLLASGNVEDAVLVFDADTGELLHKWAGHNRGVGSLNFSSDGRFLLSGGDGTLLLWEIPPRGED